MALPTLSSVTGAVDVRLYSLTYTASVYTGYQHLHLYSFWPEDFLLSLEPSTPHMAGPPPSQWPTAPASPPQHPATVSIPQLPARAGRSLTLGLNFPRGVALLLPRVVAGLMKCSVGCLPFPFQCPKYSADPDSGVCSGGTQIKVSPISHLSCILVLSLPCPLLSIHRLLC